MQTHKTKLAAKIAAQNAANAAANAYNAPVRAALAPFVGQKIVNATGELSAKVRKALPPLPGDVVLSGFYTTGHGYTLTACFKACHASEGRMPDCQIAQCGEASLYIGDLRNGVLVKLIDRQPLRTDYTEAEIQEARRKVEIAKDQLSAAMSGLAGFGEYDV